MPPYTIITCSVNGWVLLTGFADDTCTPCPTQRYHSTVGRWGSTTHTFRDLPIITMIIVTSLPRHESIDESRDEFCNRRASDTRQWSSRPIPTHQESKPIEREISYTVEQDMLTDDCNRSNDFGDSATWRSCYTLTRPFTVEVQWNLDTIYKSTLLHILQPSSLAIAFLTPTDEMRAHLSRGSSPVEAFIRQRKRRGRRSRKGRVSPWSKLISGGESFHNWSAPTLEACTMRTTDYNYDYYEDHLHCEHTDRFTISTNTAYRSTWISSSIPMTDSDLFGWPSRMSPNTLPAEANLYHHPAVQHSNELCTGRYPNAEFHISRQTIMPSATEHDLIRPWTRVHPRQCVPCAPGVFIDSACLGRASEMNGFMPQGLSGQRVPDIYTIATCHILWWMDSPRIPSRGLDGPDKPTGVRYDYLVGPVVGIDTL